MSLSQVFTRDNPVFAAYAFYASVLVLKMLVMSVLTARQRIKNKGICAYVLTVNTDRMIRLTSYARIVYTGGTSTAVFANPEDAVGLKGKVKFDHPDVERVRRAHLNDVENIPPFLLVALLYVLTKPTPLIAVNLFRAFTAARVAHTLVYAIVVVPQPARGLAWGIGYAITIYIAVQNVLFFL